MPDKRKIMAAVVVAISGLGTILGIIADAPEFISNRLPSWMANPDLWWVVGITTATAILALLILAPWRRKLPRGPVKEEALLSFLQHCVDMAGAFTGDQQRKQIESVVELSLPDFINSTFGAAERRLYNEALSAAKAQSDDPGLHLSAMLSHIYGRIVRRISREEAELLKEKEELESKLRDLKSEQRKRQTRRRDS